MREYSKILVSNLWVLRSGGADGADTAFAKGWVDANSLYEVNRAEIYIPWDGFNGLKVPGENTILVKDKYTITMAQDILKGVHPNFNNLSKGALALHTRNVFQVLGYDLNTPSAGVIAYAKLNNKGEPTGGTRTAIKIAEKFNIVVRNLYKQEDLDFIQCFIRRNSHEL